MASPLLELEGTWEEIQAHAAELAGRRVRVTVLPGASQTIGEKRALDPRNQRMLDLMEEWLRTPRTEEEQAALDGLEQHLKEHRFSLRTIQDQ